MMADFRLQDVDIILYYMDIDIVVGKPLAEMGKGQKTRQEASKDISFAYMFDTGHGGYATHRVLCCYTPASPMAAFKPGAKEWTTAA